MTERVSLDPVLESLVQRCATICEPTCCGVDACDFSPFHLASFLLRDGKKVVSETVNQRLEVALSNLLMNYGSKGASSIGAHFSTMRYISGDEIDEWVKSVRSSIVRATELINEEYRK